MQRYGLAITVALAVSGCTTGPKSLYQWGDYQPALLSYAKNPDQTAKFAERIKASIDKGEIENRVPPGLYAEYGYALVELNRQPEALEFFAKERAKWPESSLLMTRLIDRLSRSAPEKAAPPASQSVPNAIPSPAIVVPVPTPTPSPKGF